MSEHAFGFVRRHNGNLALAVVPRLMTRLGTDPLALPLGKEVWKDTRLLLPELEPGLRWHNIFTGQKLTEDAFRWRRHSRIFPSPCSFPWDGLPSQSWPPGRAKKAVPQVED